MPPSPGKNASIFRGIPATQKWYPRERAAMIQIEDGYPKAPFLSRAANKVQQQARAARVAN